MEKVQLDARLVMKIRAECPEDQRLWVGENDFGLLRAICITGGSFTGADGLKGRVVPGGADWNTGYGGSDPDSFTSTEVFAKYLLQAEDGTYIAIENYGKRDKRAEPTRIVTTPKFFAPRGKYGWLNYGVYVGALQGNVKNGQRGVDIEIYRMD